LSVRLWTYFNQFNQSFPYRRNFDGPIHFRNGTVSTRLTFKPLENNLTLVPRPRNAGLSGRAITIR
jgi:hypothetical protein